MTKQSYHVCNNKINILTQLHVERSICDEIRGHLLILLFFRPPTRVLEVLHQKRANNMKWGVVIHVHVSQNVSNIMKLKNFGIYSHMSRCIAPKYG